MQFCKLSHCADNYVNAVINEDSFQKFLLKKCIHVAEMTIMPRDVVQNACLAFASEAYNVYIFTAKIRFVLGVSES